MAKNRLNLSLDQDLVDFAKLFEKAFVPVGVFPPLRDSRFRDTAPYSISPRRYPGRGSIRPTPRRS